MNPIMKLFVLLQALGLVGMISAGPLSHMSHLRDIRPIRSVPTPVSFSNGSTSSNSTGVNTEYGPDGERVLALQSQGWDNVQAALEAGNSNSTCTKDNIVMRKEWRFLSKQERVAYTDAIQCLTTKPPPAYYDPVTAPGVKNYFDAFAAVHIVNTPYIHGDALFFPWHRYFVYVWDQTLRRECGYSGPTPYWDWSLDAGNLVNSPVFDGSPYSMGSNGAPLPNRTADFIVAAPLPTVPPLGAGLSFPVGTGGGCLYEGPFSNLTIHLGPYGLSEVAALSNELGYNPRCLKRDLNPYIIENFNSFNWTLWTLDAHDMAVFNAKAAGDGIPGIPGQGHENVTLNIFGVHGGGHFGIGGQTGSNADFYVSPQDPTFFLHHGQMDRLWTIWQSQDLANRQYAIYGTQTYLNVPASPNATLDTVLTYGPLAPSITIREAMSTVENQFCYYYE